MMEINSSCPNIPNKPPPAYSKSGLLSYLAALQNTDFKIPIRIKTPPYTYQDQFDDLINALLETKVNGLLCPVSFITATNTLGNCLCSIPLLVNQLSDPQMVLVSGVWLGQPVECSPNSKPILVLMSLGSTPPCFGQCENHPAYAWPASQSYRYQDHRRRRSFRRGRLSENDESWSVCGCLRYCSRCSRYLNLR